MRIGIISDSHRKVGRTKKGIDFLINQGVEYIIHSGDIVEIEVLQYLKKKNIVYLAVYGNNDNHLFEYHKDFNLVQEPYYFKIKELKIKLMHHPYFLNPDVDLLIYGHTHVSHTKMNGKTLFINSGEVCARDKPVSKVSLVEVYDDKFIVNMFERKLKTKNWKNIVFNYERK